MGSKGQSRRRSAVNHHSLPCPPGFQTLPSPLRLKDGLRARTPVQAPCPDAAGGATPIPPSAPCQEAVCAPWGDVPKWGSVGLSPLTTPTRALGTCWCHQTHLLEKQKPVRHLLLIGSRARWGSWGDPVQLPVAPKESWGSRQNRSQVMECHRESQNTPAV